MKVDMNRLAGAAVQETGPGPYRNLVKKGVAFVCCLSLMGAGMLFHAVQMRDSASADEMFDPLLSNPSYTVQQAADVTLPDIQAGDGPVAVLTMKGGGYSATPDEDGLVKMKTQRVSLYADYKTDWLSADTLEQMAYVSEESSAYGLEEVWIGKNPSSNNQSDFLVAKADGYGKVRFTNNPANPDISLAEGGYYKPAEDGTYTLCIEDGTVVRLVFGEKDGWSYADAAVYDYDVTDGGYYREDDYYHLGEKRDTSGALDEAGPVHVDAILSGINSPRNYKGAGAKLAFGADKIGMDLAEESLTGELDNLNIYNYTQQEKTDMTGATLGLAKSVARDGNIVWADGVSAPLLFAGNAEGKTEYPEEYSLGFTDRGVMQVLSSVESEWGTAADGLEKLGQPFWILDGAPSFATDGHDIAWGTGDENLLYYRSGDRAAEVLPASADGLEHNRYFGLSWTMDFTLEPGYTGPLNVFGISDDDLWVFAARLDENGRVMEETAVQAVDLGGVHERAGGWCDLWDVIEKVPADGEAQDWRLFVFSLERDGDGAELYFACSLPEKAERAGRETGTIMVEASNYESVKGAVRSFVLNNGGHDFYKLTYDDGRELTITDGEPFQIASGSFASIDGMDTGTVFKVRETGRENVWHSTGDGYTAGNEAQCTVGHSHRIRFLSTVDSGTLTLAAAAEGEPEHGYGFTIRLKGMKEKEVQAMDGFNNPLGTQFTDKEGDIRVSLAAGEILTLYGLPDGTEFEVSPDEAAGWHLAEILLDNASAEGVNTSGSFPAYVIYRYEQNEEQPLQVFLEQSVSGDWGVDEIALKEGALLSYRISVTNPNAVPMAASIEDTLPEGLEILESSVADGVVNGQNIRWEMMVEPGKTAEAAFTCKVISGDELSNTAVLMDGLEPKQASNTVTAILPE